MATTDDSRPEWAVRLMAAACYFGLSPLLSLLRRNRDDVFFVHHRNQALATLLLLFLLLLAWPIDLLLETYFVRHYTGRPPDFMVVLLPGLGLVSLVLLLGMGMALAGSIRPMPLITRLVPRRGLIRLTMIGNGMLLVLVPVVVGLSVHASSMTREDVVPAPVYFLYDNRGWGMAEKWLPKLVCYRLSRVAQNRWGSRSVVVAPLSHANLAAAFKHGRFVWLAGHGRDGNLLMVDDSWSGPSSIRGAMSGKDLQFVYLSQCYAGRKADEWQRALAPAEIVTFDRLTTDLESLWWMIFEAPGRLQAVREKTRNPFDVKDVLAPDGDDVKEFAANTRLSGDGEDANAPPWAEEPTAGEARSLEGEWFSRWNTNLVEKDWITGRATLKVVGDRVYILYKDETNTCLIDARRDGKRRLVGRYVNLGNPAVSTPWAGVVVDHGRIDGGWANGRWDLRRKIDDK